MNMLRSVLDFKYATKSFTQKKKKIISPVGFRRCIPKKKKKKKKKKMYEFNWLYMDWNIFKKLPYNFGLP